MGFLWFKSKAEREMEVRNFLDSRISSGVTLSKHIPVIAFGLALVTQMGAGVWWAADISSKVENREKVVDEKITKIEKQLDGTSLIQITKSELNSKLELFRLQSQTNNENLLLFKQENKEKYIQFQKIQEQLNLRISVIQKQITSLEKTINLLYINNSKIDK